MRERLSRALGASSRDGTSDLLRSALRDFVRSAREAGLGAGSVLAEVDVAWRRGSRGASPALTRDVLEVATLLELGAGDDAPPRRAGAR